MRKLCVLLILFVFSCSGLQAKPRLTLDEFLEHTEFALPSFSPDGRYLLFRTTRPSWNTSSYERNLWIYDIQQQTRRLITTKLDRSIEPRWSPSGKWIALRLDETPSNATKINRYRRSSSDPPLKEQRIHLYSLASNDLLPIETGKDFPLALAWSDNDSSLYLATTNSEPINKDEEEWRDVKQYRDNKKDERSTIYRININPKDSLLSVERNIVADVSFFLRDLSYAPVSEKLVFISLSPLIEDLQGFEIYSVDLRNTSSSLTRLTDNEAFEDELKISKDGQHVLFLSASFSRNSKNPNTTQTHLYSLNLMSGQTTQLAKNFDGAIKAYITTSSGDVYFLGQLRTETQIYLQRPLSDEVVPLIGWNGTYESITLSNHDSIAFIHSSTEKPMEVYLASSIDQLRSAQAITNENKLFTERDLPRTKVYRWKNEEDQQIIEGMLHYPPGKFEAKNLPLLVYMHGGPSDVSTNHFYPDFYYWAPLAASEGWLVLEPNYRGSTAYGDQFLNQIRYRPLSLPGKDILYGVDQLIRDGIADPYQLAVGGYSYGGFLTNWLITQTKRFNAALSGAGAIDHSSTWGTMDIPVLLYSLFGGYPWDTPYIYQSESPIYQLDRVRTPTLITTGENDVRVPASQSYIMERGLYYRRVPVKLLLFPNEGHPLDRDPWHGKIKMQEELKWLQKYGHQSSY